MDHLSKEAYVTKIPSEVRGVLSGEMSNAAVLVVADLQGHAPQADLERTACKTMAAMPDAATRSQFHALGSRVCYVVQNCVGFLVARLPISACTFPLRL